MPTGSPATTATVEISLTECLVLALVAEGPTHGFAVARLTADDGPVGRVYRVPRPLVYRAIDRLALAGLVEAVRVEPGNRGPQRTLFTVTEEGQLLVDDWLSSPVRHARDVRTELLMKLALLDRLGADAGPLLAAQHEALGPIVEALAQQQQLARGFDRTLAAWRHECTASALRFVEEMQA
ncbi:MAG: PadR family transcriptional regulator [Acidimicrobiales bacterium]